MSHSVEVSLTQLLRCITPTHRQFIRCWRPHGQTVFVSFHATVRWTAADPSVHPVLKASSWCVSVLIQTERRIDRRCPHLGCRIIRCYCLRCSSSATHPTLLGNGPSVHPTVPRVSPCVPTRLTIAPTLAILMLSVHPTVSFLFLFFLRVFTSST
jgi:hypothetical protein